jgi:hypothetical protein
VVLNNDLLPVFHRGGRPFVAHSGVSVQEPQADASAEEADDAEKEVYDWCKT